MVSPLQFLGPVVVCQCGGQGAEPGKFLGRKAVQSKSEQHLVLLRIHHEFLQLIEDVSVEEAVVSPVDVQGPGRRKSRLDQQ